MQIDYSKFTEKVHSAINGAYQLTISCHYAKVEDQVMMISLINEGRDMVFFLLQEMGVDKTTFCQAISASLASLQHSEGTRPDISDSTQRILTNAISIASENGSSVVALEHIFWSFVDCSGPVKDIMTSFGITNASTRTAVIAFRNGNINHDEYRQEREQGNLRELNKYARNMVVLAEEGRIEPAIGRDDEIRRILQILSRKTKNNPMLVGAPGTGKTAIVEGLAHRLVRGDVPRELTGLKLYSLDISSLVAGTSRHGEFEERLKKVISEVKSDPDVVLFIDEIHLLIDAGGSLNAANILKPELARGEIKVIGATTIEEFTQFVESDKAFERRFQKIVVDEPNTEDAITIMRGIKSRFEAFHRIKILDEAIVSAVRLSQRYIPGRYLPDKAIDLIDEAAAKMRIERSSVPVELDELSAQIRSKEMERESLRQDEESHDLSALDAEIANLREAENELNARWQNERQRFEDLQTQRNALGKAQADFAQAERSGQYEAAVVLQGKIDSLNEEIASMLDEINHSESALLKSSLNEDDVRAVVQTWTGIPVNKLSEDESEKLLMLEDKLEHSVIGQKAAIASVSQVVRRNRMGFGDEGKPIGTFLFLGTTGVGKTELAKVLADCLFNSRDMLIRLDMSEYQQEFSVSRLFGAPPGYVGYDQGGQLTEVVRQKPYSVILLDEIEKAHPKVFETLLQVLDDGRMTDGQGRIIDFKNTIIIMTSNMGADTITQMLIGGGRPEDTVEKAKQEVLQILKGRMSPEFLNRIDDVVMFLPLGKNEIEDIVRIQVERLCAKLIKNGFDVEFDDRAICFLTERSYIPEYGARPVKRTLNELFVNVLTLKVLNKEVDGAKKIQVSSDGERLTFINIE